METYYLYIFKNKNLILHYATIRSDWKKAEWKHLAETFPQGYFYKDGRKLYVADVPKLRNWKNELKNWEVDYE